MSSLDAANESGRRMLMMHTQHFLQVANLQLDGAKQPHNDPDCQPAGCQA